MTIYLDKEEKKLSSYCELVYWKAIPIYAMRDYYSNRLQQEVYTFQAKREIT